MGKNTHPKQKKNKVLRDSEIVTRDFSSISSSNISTDNDSGCDTKPLDDGLMMCTLLQNPHTTTVVNDIQRRFWTVFEINVVKMVS